MAEAAAVWLSAISLELKNLRQEAIAARGELDATVAAATQAAASVKTKTGEIATAVEQLRDQAERSFAGLADIAARTTGPWGDEIKLQLDLLDIGGQRLDQFLRKWGDAKVVTEEGVKSIREMVDKLDVRGVEQKVQELTLALRRGSADLGEAVDFLREKGGRLTDQLVAAIEAFRKGTGSLDRILALASQLKTVTGGDSALDELVDAIGDGLRDGSFG